MSEQDEAQQRWERMVDYACACVVEEMAQTWVPLIPGKNERLKWFPGEGEEKLVSGRASSIDAPSDVAKAISADGGGRLPLLYGWPVMVLDRRKDGGKLERQITPIYLMRLERTKQDAGCGWLLSPSHTPEFNAASLARAPEDSGVASEINCLDMPMNNADGMASIAAEAARALGHEPPDLHPDACESLTAGENLDPGLYNASIFLAVEFAHFRFHVREDLSDLKSRTDWANTAAAWLIRPPQASGRKRTTPPLAPLPCNVPQEDALQAIRKRRLSIITGPPGTGKTQLVVNAVANAWSDGDTVLLASTNNAAVDVAFDRAKTQIAPGLLIRTGTKERKQEVPALISASQDAVRKHLGPEPERAVRAMWRAYEHKAVLTGQIAERREAERRLTALIRKVDDFFVELADEAGCVTFGEEKTAQSMKNVRDRLSQHLADWEAADRERRMQPAFQPSEIAASRLRVAKKHTLSEAAEIGRKAEHLNTQGVFGMVSRIRLRSRLGCPSGTCMSSIAQWAASVAEDDRERRRRAEHTAKERLLEAAEQAAAAKLVWGMRDAVKAFKGADEKQLLAWAKQERKLLGMEAERDKMSAKCENLETADAINDNELRDADSKWHSRSLAAIRSLLAASIATPRPGALPAFSSVSQHHRAFGDAVMRSLPILKGWACTSMSARGSFPLHASLFDLLIVDEASQCTLADILPLAYRAKRMAIIGDPNQLRSITTLGESHLAHIAKDAGQDESEMRLLGTHHKDGSAYMAFDRAGERGGAEPPQFISEHYRCHPQIAKWFNREFYGGALQVLTRVDEDRGARVLMWHDVSEESRRPRGRGGWVNPGQASMAVRLVKDSLAPNRSIGVIAPYVSQARTIEDMAKNAIDESALAEAKFVSGTAHKLQGAERDVIVFSTTFTPNMPQASARWIQSERNLINVAVSRAKRHLIVIGHPDLDGSHSETLASLRDYIIGVNKENEADDGHVHSHSDAERLLLAAMKKIGFSPIGKIDVSGYELDFALVAGDAKLNIEVDGDQHGAEDGRRSDMERDAVLTALGWNVLRIKAWRCLNAPDDAAALVRQHWRSIGGKASA